MKNQLTEVIVALVEELIECCNFHSNMTWIIAKRKLNNISNKSAGTENRYPAQANNMPLKKNKK